MVTNNVPYAWGQGTNGQLGQGTSATARSSPVLVTGAHSFTQVAAAQNTSMGLKADGTVWCWGNANSGALGDQTITDKSSPVLVVGAHSFTQIAMGGINGGLLPANGFGLKADGSLWGWGVNSTGQLGNQSATNRSSPVLVVGAHSFSEVRANLGTLSGGIGTTAARKADGSVWCWGFGNSGQHGDQTTASESSPVLVVGAHSFRDIQVGVDSVHGRKADGSVWAWGNNSWGQLGNQSITSRSSPVLVVGAHSFTAIAAGCLMMMGLKADGSVWCWGRNVGGSLGDQTITEKSSPVLVVGAHSFVAIARGGAFSQAVKADGSIWTWGTNTSAQLGDQTTTSKSSPVLVVGPMTFAALGGGDLHSLAIQGLPPVAGGVLQSGFFFGV